MTLPDKFKFTCETTTALKLLAEAQTIIETYAPGHTILLAEIEQFLAATKQLNIHPTY